MFVLDKQAGKSVDCRFICKTLYREKVLNLPSRNKAPSCPLVPEKFDEEPNFLDDKHQRDRVRPAGVAATAANGDLSSYMGQQIPFNQIVALGALQKTSSGTYVQANGYTEGKHRVRTMCNEDTHALLGWDDCSDTPVRPAPAPLYSD